MTSQKQIESNRRNAMKSTGPSTAEGKASSRLNAMQHGLTASHVVIAGEDPEEYAQLLESLRGEFSPLDGITSHLVELLAQQIWRLKRVPRLEGALLAWQQRTNLIADKNVPAGIRAQSSRRLPLPVDLTRPRLVTNEGEASGDRDLDNLHRLGRTLQKLLSEQDYLHRLSRYETTLLKNFNSTLMSLLRLKNRRLINASTVNDKPSVRKF